ncbi:MAG: DUF551 domain-containing protein [Holophaga sp.]|nr:DUF551 domain-containing protein [Holophaga sp.]
MSEWQPIATAPKDGSILIGRGSYDSTEADTMLAVAMRYQSNQWWRENAGEGFTIACHPTHWMHMPAPPKPQDRLVGFKACGRDQEELFIDGKSWERCIDADAQAWFPWPPKPS